MFKKSFSKSKDRFDRKSGGRPSSGGGWNKGSQDHQQLHRATCASCGNSCEVPFKPNGSKPVYCLDCFGKNNAGARPSYSRNTRSDGSADQTNAQLKQINEKLDAILSALHTNV
jgi:CxxC-x17-CxxC domain-containing protein